MGRRRRGESTSKVLQKGATVLLVAALLACFASQAAAQPGKSKGNGFGSSGNNGNGSSKGGNGGGGAQGCDCNRIPLKPGPPVCGDDGIEYINSCLAECQGVAVVKNGGCPGNVGKPEWLAVKNADPDGYATLAEVQQFQREGFKMTGKFKGKKLPPRKPAPRPKVVDDPKADMLKPDASDPESFEMRFTPSGNSFVRKVKNGSSPGRSGGDAPNFVLQPEEDEDEEPETSGMNRKMLLLATIVGGSDDRVEQTRHAWPYSAVGVVGERCSGALIGPTSVLTAGHCVYDLMSRTYMEGFDFRPNAHRGEGHMAERHGRPTYKAKYASTMYHNAGLPQSCGGDEPCSTFKDWTYDYAVIELEEDIGNKRGWLGLRYECGPQALDVETAGYPGDLPEFPTRQYTVTGTMDPFDGCVEDVANGHVRNNLDSAVGQSGSPVWDSDKYIRALVSNSYPGSRTITWYTYFKIQNWVRFAF